MKSQNKVKVKALKTKSKKQGHRPGSDMDISKVVEDFEGPDYGLEEIPSLFHSLGQSYYSKRLFE